LIEHATGRCTSVSQLIKPAASMALHFHDYHFSRPLAQGTQEREDNIKVNYIAWMRPEVSLPPLEQDVE
jgi:hypothetical protein